MKKKNKTIDKCFVNGSGDDRRLLRHIIIDVPNMMLT